MPGYKWQAKSFALTYAPPVGFATALISREIIMAVLKTRGRWKGGMVAKEDYSISEKRKTRESHYHAWAEYWDKVSAKGDWFDVAGVHPHHGKRNDGKTRFSKMDYAKKYCLKEDQTPLLDGSCIGIREYTVATIAKKASRQYLIANLIADKQTTNKELNANRDYRPILMTLGPKIDQYREECRLQTQEHIRIWPFSEGFIQGILKSHGADHANFCQWWNYRMFAKKFQKQNSICYMHSEQKSIGKSTLLKTVSEIGNGSSDVQWDFHDKGWQERLDRNIRVLPIDALQTGKQISLSLLEKIGDNSSVTFKQRNTKRRNTFRGACIITSNVSIEQLKPPEMATWDTSVLLERCLVLNFDEMDVFPIIDELCRIHKLDPSKFRDDTPMKVYKRRQNPFKLMMPMKRHKPNQ